MSFNHTEVEKIITSFEKQAARMFKIILLLLLSNLFFMYLYFKNPQTVDINLAQDKTDSSTQTVSR